MTTVTERLTALDRIQEIAADNGEGLLETLQYMDRNLFQFDPEDRQAFRTVFAEFQKLFAELIVRECAKVADDGFASSNFGNGITGHQLLKHFGVEE